MTRQEAWDRIKRIGEQKLRLRQTVGWQTERALELLRPLNQEIDRLIRIMYPPRDIRP